jgi:hypothetical protein
MIARPLHDTSAPDSYFAPLFSQSRTDWGEFANFIAPGGDDGFLGFRGSPKRLAVDHLYWLASRIEIFQQPRIHLNPELSRHRSLRLAVPER